MLLRCLCLIKKDDLPVIAMGLTGRTILHMLLLTQFVLIKVEPSRITGFWGVEPLYGMQGVRSSSLLGSISKRTQSTTEVLVA